MSGAELTEREKRLLAALYEIRMEAEKATVDEPVWALPTRIIGMALGALGGDKRLAQELAAASRRATSGVAATDQSDPSGPDSPSTSEGV